ncbi:unnamed protein product [Bursaphelenchus okinawaensis]|uniref:Acyl-CoA dehydrogenase/oxidase N-terminal domain-containing protein n=1 Tax=Bursaphelenchus okinawaensis TaxID=465554 RepID=A0A811JQ03_9BILA|nr:unnamed protein product [Bursaphelenchus okinawaensis]CAG9077457.1 unnamed protein product [Bursaphelenchus okinawaensis]
MRVLRLSTRHLRQCRRYSSEIQTDSAQREVKKEPEVPKFLSNAQVLEDKRVPVEKKSISRGLMLNRFEKDFLIYPELDDKKAADNIQAYCRHLKYVLEVALKSNDPIASVNQVLLQNYVFAAYVKKEFGGMEMNRREIMCVNEVIGNQDLSSFCNVSSVQLATFLIQNFGNEEQVKRLLPKVGTGQIRVALGTDNVSESRSLRVSTFNDKLLLNGKVENLINGADADIFLCFALEKNDEGKETIGCYIVDKDNIKGKVKIESARKTMGLENVKFSNIKFSNVELSPLDKLENNLTGDQIFASIAEMNRSLNASGAIGAMKRVLADLSIKANRTMSGRHKTLSQNSAVISVVNTLVREIHYIESVLYYINGLSDEQLFVVNDLESMIVEKLVCSALRKTILSLTEVMGITSVDSDLPYNKWLRDVATFSCLLNNEHKLSAEITKHVVQNMKDENMKWHFPASRLMFMFVPQSSTFKPLPTKMTHFIAEHVHYSLKNCATRFEFGMGQCQEAVYKTLGKNKYQIPTGKERQIENIISEMTVQQVLCAALLARTSRSYSIGLKNGDVEFQWTNEYGLKFERSIRVNIRELWHVWKMKDYNKPVVHKVYPFKLPQALQKAVEDERGFEFDFEGTMAEDGEDKIKDDLKDEVKADSDDHFENHVDYEKKNGEKLEKERDNGEEVGKEHDNGQEVGKERDNDQEVEKEQAKGHEMKQEARR